LVVLGLVVLPDAALVALSVCSNSPGDRATNALST
jgi:hypothetical protein